MRPLSLAVVLATVLAAACGRAPVFVPYADPAAEWSMEVPKDWAVEADKPDRLPIREARFIGAQEPQLEGQILGAVLSLRRISRRRADFPGDDKAFQKYSDSFLKPADRLFGDDASAAEKPFESAYSLTGGPFHGNAVFPVRVQGAVYRTADAYYELKFLASKDKFDAYRYAYERAHPTFALKKR